MKRIGIKTHSNKTIRETHKQNIPKYLVNGHRYDIWLLFKLIKSA